MNEASPTKRRLLFALIVVLGILSVASVVALATGRTGAVMALGSTAYGLFLISVATRILPIRHRSDRRR